MSKRHHRNRRRLVVSPQVRIRKSSGLLERFSSKKLRSSLLRCGTPRTEANRIAVDIRDSIQRERPSDFSTSDIRSLVLARLKNAAPTAATRYNLAQSVQRLGPTGFPFEKLIGQLYESEGYQVQVNRTRPGLCVSHEIDVIARKDGKTTFMECKFHNSPGMVCDLKVALYVKARSEDLNNADREDSRHDTFALITNTRFSTDAIKYGSCAGLELIGWTYPEKNSLARRLEVSGLIPLTALTTLPKKMADLLMQSGIVTIRDWVDDPSAWDFIRGNKRLAERIQAEIDSLFELGY